MQTLWKIWSKLLSQWPHDPGQLLNGPYNAVAKFYLPPEGCEEVFSALLQLPMNAWSSQDNQMLKSSCLKNLQSN